MPKIWNDDDGMESLSFTQVNDQAKRLDKKADQNRGSRGFDTNLQLMVGLCAKCEHYVYIEDDMHQIIHSACKGLNWENPVVMTKRKVVRNCSEFTQKGQPNIQTMFTIATLIDPPEEAKIKGFVPNKTKEKKHE